MQTMFFIVCIFAFGFLASMISDIIHGIFNNKK
jgi:hypothetical protein